MEIEKIFKILIVIGLLVLLIQIRIRPLDNCDACNFNIFGQEINGGDEFMKLYSEKCFKEPKISTINLPNASANNP